MPIFPKSSDLTILYLAHYNEISVDEDITVDLCSTIVSIISSTSSCPQNTQGLGPRN